MSVSFNNSFTNFKANQKPVVQEKKVVSNPQEHKGLSRKTKIAIGAGLAALAVAGIYIATRGKAKVKVASPSTGETGASTASEMVGVALDTFKEKGNKFVNGKAIDAEGNPFTGIITHQTKKGVNVAMQYENGLLTKSTKGINNDKTINLLDNFEKEYIRDAEGKITDVKKMVHCTDGGKSRKVSNLNKMRTEGIQNYLDEQKRLQRSAIDLSNNRNEFFVEQAHQTKEKEYNNLFNSVPEYSGELKEGENTFVVKNGKVTEATNGHGQKWDLYSEHTLPEYKEKIETMIDVKRNSGVNRKDVIRETLGTVSAEAKKDIPVAEAVAAESKNNIPNSVETVATELKKEALTVTEDSVQTPKKVRKGNSKGKTKAPSNKPKPQPRVDKNAEELNQATQNLEAGAIATQPLCEELNNGMTKAPEMDFTRRGSMGQDLDDPLEPLNKMDIMSPYYEDPVAEISSQTPLMEGGFDVLHNDFNSMDLFHDGFGF